MRPRGDIIKQGDRNIVSRFIPPRDDTDKMAGWKSELDRVLRDLNVSPIARHGHR